MSNITQGFCHKVVAPEAPSVFQNGKILLQAYHIGWIISGSLSLVAVITSFWLIGKHLQWYTNKREQRYIVRLLFMVPLYAVISFGSFLFWNHSTPLILVRDAYESIVLTAFFYLLLMYLSQDVEEQKRIFLKRGLSVEADAKAKKRGDQVSEWVFPLGFIQWKPKDGLYFLQLMKWGILQYCVVRPITTLAAVTLDLLGLYCEGDWGLRWGYIYITIVVSISVSIAMYCLIQLYVTVSKELSMHEPLLKLFSVKAVVFLTFWQATFLSVLSMFKIVKDTKYMTAQDVNIGIGAVLETFEMMIFAFLHIKAFSFQPYKSLDPNIPAALPPSRTPQWQSLGHAMDFRETFREIWVGCFYMVDKMRGKEPKPDFGVIREAHYETAFGRRRPLPGKIMWPQQMESQSAKPHVATFPALGIEVDQRIEIEVEGQRQWLHLNTYDPRVLHTKQKSEGLQEQIDNELERLGHPKCLAKDIQNCKPEIEFQMGDRPQRSWFRSFYNRISHSGQEVDEVEREPLKQRHFSPSCSSRCRHFDDEQLSDMGRYLDDQPPQGYDDDNQDRFLSKNGYPPLPSSVQTHWARHQPIDQHMSVSVSSEFANKGVFRIPHVGSNLPLAEFRTRSNNNVPLSYKSPDHSTFSGTSQAHLSRENKKFAQARPSSMLPRSSLVMPSPLDPRSQSRLGQPYVWKPPYNDQGYTPVHSSSLPVSPS